LRGILILFLALTLPGVVWGQSIAGVSGNVEHGGTLVVLGSSFGSKTGPAPVIWDDMESGSFHSEWSSTNTLSISPESRHSNSAFCGTNNFQGTERKVHGYFTGGDPDRDTWFCQYWFKLDQNFDWGDSGSGTMGANLANVKIFRLWNPGREEENFVMATRGYASSTSIQYYAENVDNPGGGYFGNLDSWTRDEWHCLQFEYRESSVGGNDGMIRVWQDGALILDDHDIKTREDSALLKRPFILGFYNSWVDGGTDRDDFYIDDAYIDNSLARVEVGNAIEFNQCTHREIQIPTQWNSDQIEVTMNLGSFDSQDDLYVFVVDENGQASVGFPLTSRMDGPGIPGKPIRD